MSPRRAGLGLTWTFERTPVSQPWGRWDSYWEYLQIWDSRVRSKWKPCRSWRDFSPAGSCGTRAKCPSIAHARRPAWKDSRPLETHVTTVTTVTTPNCPAKVSFFLLARRVIAGKVLRACARNETNEESRCQVSKRGPHLSSLANTKWRPESRLNSIFMSCAGKGGCISESKPCKIEECMSDTTKNAVESHSILIWTYLYDYPSPSFISIIW